jgi:hypothetical protein
MRCAWTTLSSVARPPLQCFSTLSHKRHDFRGGGELLNIKCVLFFSTTFVQKKSHSMEKSREILSHMCIRKNLSSRYSCKIVMEVEFYRKIFG